jgi:uncharacterized integral membrane protein
MATGSTPQPGAAPARRSRRETARLVAVGTLAVLVTLFAVFNLDAVQVHLIVDTVSLPLIVVIVVCVLAGAIFGMLLERRRRHRQR